MEMLQIVMSGVASLLGVIIGGLLLFWKGYWSKSGENQATKEDIEDITKLVQDLKDKLELVQESKISFQSLRREAIINYYEKYLLWINHLAFAEFDGKVYNEVKKEFDKQQREVDNAESKLRLFVEEFDQFVGLMSNISYHSSVIQANYYLSLQRIESIVNNTHLRPDIIQAFYFLKDEQLQKYIFPDLATLTQKMRDLIKQGVK